MPTITQERLALLPTPSEFGRELPFWLALCCWAFLPATKTPLIQILNIPVSAYDLILFALLPFALVSISTSKRLGTLGRLHVVFLLLLAYAGISYLWAQREGPVATGVYYTLVLAAAAFLVPYAYSRTTSSAGLLWRLTVCIALITLYTASNRWATWDFGALEEGSGRILESAGFVVRSSAPAQDTLCWCRRWPSRSIAFCEASCSDRSPWSL